MRALVLIGFLSIASFQGCLIAGELDISISNDTGKIGYSMPYSNERYRQSRLQSSILFNNDADYIAEAGMHISGEIGTDVPGLNAGVGVDLVVGSANNATLVGLPLAFSLGYTPNVFPRLILRGDFKFAPDILAYADTTQYRESSIQMDYELFPETFFYLGSRHITVDLDKGGKSTVDNGVHVGIRFGF